MLNIAPFAHQTRTSIPPAVEWRWEEPRDIRRVLLHFPTEPSDAEQIRLLYWRHLWPETRWELRDDTSQWAGWESQDDWYIGGWQQAQATSEASGSDLVFTFRPLAESEFPDLTGYNVSFRRTLKLRIESPIGATLPVAVKAFVDTPLAEAEICILLDSSAAGDGQLEGYNCEVISLSALPGTAQPRVLASPSWTAPIDASSYGFRARLRYAPGRTDDHPDRSILTVRYGRRGFSFLVDPVADGKIIHAPAIGVRIWPAALGEAPPPATAGRTIYDRIFDLPEQSYQRAKSAMPPRKPLYFVLGCEGARQKFKIEPDGDLSCPPNYVARVPGRDTPNLKGQGTACYRFGLERSLRVSRFIEDGYLPIIRTGWLNGPLRIEQTAFATPVCASILDGAVQGDDPIAAMVRFRLTNTGESHLAAHLPLRAVRVVEEPHSEIPEALTLHDGLACACGDAPGATWLRMIATCSDGALAADEAGLTFRAELPPGSSADLLLKVPFVVLGPSQIEALRAKDFAREHAELRRFWQQRANEGCEVETPGLDLNDFYRAHLTHMLITNDREVGSNRLMVRVGSLNYGNCVNESCMCIADLDRRGYHEVAERALDTYLRYQGTSSLSGNFSTSKGQFFGSGGYEHELGQYYVQSHGWVLWCLAQHYLYTRDNAWLRRAAPHLVEGCDWIVHERQATKLSDENGRKALEWGLLPAGGLEDVGDWYYWLSNNAFSWWGLRWAAHALADIGHPDAPRLANEASAYRQDILAAFREASLRAPLVRLRDGSYVPHMPSRVHLRGRDSGWIRETLEGAIHLVCTELLDPDSDEATWILKDYEDNRYLSPRYGYLLDDADRWWFDRGGFSRQPNLLGGPIAYLLRDDIEHYLRAYFNAFAVAFREDTRMCTEHPLPTFADWAGDHFKTSDEAQSAHWLRLMFVQEVGDELHLGRALPRHWLADGSRVAIRRAATHFGRMSLEIESAVAKGRIAVALDPPLRNPPSRIRLRLRHPDRLSIGKVEIDGGSRAGFVVEGDWVIFPSPPAPIRILALY